METWTERLDDLAASLRPLPAEGAKVAEAVTRLTEETRSPRVDLSASQRQIAQIGWLLALALVGAIAALLLALG